MQPPSRAPIDLAALESDDRRTTATTIQPGDRVLLIVEDDLNFAPILLDVAREKGFKGMVASAATSAWRWRGSCKPDAITLDIDLPGSTAGRCSTG